MGYLPKLPEGLRFPESNTVKYAPLHTERTKLNLTDLCKNLFSFNIFTIQPRRTVSQPVLTPVVWALSVQTLPPKEINKNKDAEESGEWNPSRHRSRSYLMEAATRTGAPGLGRCVGSRRGRTTAAWLGGVQLGPDLYRVGRQTFAAVCCGGAAAVSMPADRGLAGLR